MVARRSFLNANRVVAQDDLCACAYNCKLVIVITCYVIDVLRWSQAIYIGETLYPKSMIGDRCALTPVHAGGRIQTDAVGKKFLDWLWLGKGGRDRRRGPSG